MPQIPQYTAPSPGIAAPETGVEARAQAGRRLGAFFHQEGGELGSAISGASSLAQEYIDHQQISHGALGEAALINDMTTKWENLKNDPNFDPNDPLVAQRFRAQVLEPALEKFNNGFTSSKAQNWALERTEKIRDHFFEKTAADVGNLAYIKSLANLDKIGNINANTAAANPSIAGTRDIVGPGGQLETQWRSQYTPTMKAEDRAKGDVALHKKKADVVHSALAEAISRSPDPEKTVKEWSAAFPDLITPEVERASAKAAVVQNKNNALTERLLLQSQRTQASEEMNQSVTQAMNAGMMVDPQNPGRFVFDPDLPKALLKIARDHSDAPGVTQRVQSEINWIQHQESGRVATADNPTIRDALTDRIRKGTASKVDIRSAEADGQLKPMTARRLEGLWDTFNELPKGDVVLNSKLEAVKAGFEKSPIKEMTDPYGGEDYANFLDAFSREYLKKVRDGTLQPGDLDLKNPNSMISKAKADAAPPPGVKWQRIQNSMGGGSMMPGGGSIVGGSAEPRPGTEFTHPADWQQSPSTGQWLDPKTGDVWSKSGGLIRRGWPKTPSPAPVVPQSQ